MRLRFASRAAILLAAPLTVGGLCGSAAAADGDSLVVRRGTAELTLSEIDARMEEVPPDKRAGVMDSPERIDTVLQQMLLVEQLADEAIAEGLDKDPRLEAQLDLARKRLLTQLRLEQLREAAKGKVDVEALARERYAANRASYAVPETRTVRHLLVSIERRGEAEARRVADELARRLAAGESLEALAREASDDDTTKGEGGLIADIAAGTTDPAFDTAMQALAGPGAKTPTPVRSQYGWHLIELVSINPGRQKPFEEVREQLVAEVAASNVDRQVRSHTDQLNSLPIDADPDLVASLRTRYQQPAAAAAPGSGQAPKP